jgi:hypothetical protein
MAAKAAAVVASSISSDSHLFEDNFGPNLTHKIDYIKDQVEAGQYTIKRIAFFLKKVCALIKVTSGEGVKATEHEISSKKSRIDHDLYVHYKPLRITYHCILIRVMFV